MARVFLTDNLKNVSQSDLQTTMEMILQQLQDQINAGPSFASLVNSTDALPQGMLSGDLVFNIQDGELRVGVFNGVEVLYASFGSFVGAITDTQHGTRSGGDLHSDATAAASGFMPAADKSKSDKFKGNLSGGGPVSLTELPNNGDWCFYNNTGAGTFFVATNFSGTIKSAVMT